ncbi:MAG: hypothetical protein AB7L66_23015 [Gemmatimonadales bacterium]
MRAGIRAAAIALVTLAGTVAAQAPGIPVANAGAARGLTVGGMVAFPNAAAGDGRALGATGAIGFRRVALVGQVTRVTDVPADEDGYYGAGGALVLKVAGGPLVPVAVYLLAGAGYAAIGTGVNEADQLHVPVSLGISWTIPQPVVALKPWVAPRIDHRRYSVSPLLAKAGAGGLDYTTTDFGLSGGLTLGFLNGIGIDLAFDRVFSDGPGSKPTIFGVGLSWNLR